MEKLSPKERIQTIMAGEKPDRMAASFWRHFFHMENNAEGTAEAMLYFQKKFNWDFMKINPRADYHIEGWGFKHKWSTSEFEKHQKLVFPVQSIEDWAKIQPLDNSSPALAEHLKMVNLIRKGSIKELPLLMTVFNPLGIAGRMVPDKKMLVEHLRTAPEKVLPAIEAITLTFEKFTEELRNAGADGLFFATLQWASSDFLTWDEYQKFGVPYDLRIMDKIGGDAINILHVCYSNNYLKELSKIDYKSKMYNWDAEHPTNLPIDKAMDAFPDKIIVGGVDHEGWLLHSPPDEVGYKIDELKKRYDPARLILAPGCAIPPEVPFDNLKVIREKL